MFIFEQSVNQIQNSWPIFSKKRVTMEHLMFGGISSPCQSYSPYHCYSCYYHPEWYYYWSLMLPVVHSLTVNETLCLEWKRTRMLTRDTPIHEAPLSEEMWVEVVAWKNRWSVSYHCYRRFDWLPHDDGDDDDNCEKLYQPVLVVTIVPIHLEIVGQDSYDEDCDDGNVLLDCDSQHWWMVMDCSSL